MEGPSVINTQAKVVRLYEGTTILAEPEPYKCHNIYLPQGNKEDQITKVIYSNKTCAICSKETKLKCERCNLVSYCSKECQQDHFKKIHKNECFLPKISYKENKPKINKWQQEKMIENIKFGEMKRRIPMIGIYDNSTDDTLACLFAMIQSLPPLPGYDFEEILEKIESNIINSKDIKILLNDLINSDLNFTIEDFISLQLQTCNNEQMHEQKNCMICHNLIKDNIIKLNCGHVYHASCYGNYRDFVGQDIKCHICKKTQVPRFIIVNIKIPSELKQGDSFNFSLDSKYQYKYNNEWYRQIRSWSITPESKYKSNDMIKIKVDLGKDNNTIDINDNKPFSMEEKLNLEIYENKNLYNPWYLKTITSLINCQNCKCNGDYSNINLSRLSITLNNSREDLSLESLIKNYLNETQCYNCKCLSKTTLVESKATFVDEHIIEQIYNKDGDYWSYKKRPNCIDTRILPTGLKIINYIINLPPILYIYINRNSYSFKVKIDYSMVDIPLVGLYLSQYFSKDCPPPENACSLYDLRFIGKFSPICRDPDKLIGKIHKHTNARYNGYSKSAVDNLWYEYDICNSAGSIPRPELNVAERINSMSATCLIYVRQDIMSSNIFSENDDIDEEEERKKEKRRKKNMKKKISKQKKKAREKLEEEDIINDINDSITNIESINQEKKKLKQEKEKLKQEKENIELEKEKIKKLEKVFKQKEEDELCLICLDNKKNYMFEPCMHISICYECQLMYKKKICIQCRQPIKKISKVYS